MAITEADIKFLASERLTDADDGGGAMTANVIVDGQLHNVFGPISSLDRTQGRVSIRKVFGAVTSATRDTYLGATAIIDDAPDDPRVSVTMFSTGAWFDTRSEIRNYVEQYVVRGARHAAYLYDTQVAGAAAITLFQRLEAPLPQVNDVLVLIQNEGMATEFEQYVRITAVSAEVRTFTEDSPATDFQRRVIVCELSDALRHTFAGANPRLRDADVWADRATTAKAIVRKTLAADAARYYGIKPLTANAGIGDLSVHVQSIFAQLVPSAQIENPVLDAQAGGELSAMVRAGAALTRTLTAAAGGTATLRLGGGAEPGSVSVDGAGYTWLDDGTGNVLRAGTVVGAIDYPTGLITFADAVAAAPGPVNASWVPAASVLRVGNSLGVVVTSANRGYNWVRTLSPIPAPGALLVSYMAQGKWYALRDDGSGVLAPEGGGAGGGSVNYTTGTTLATLAALPDVGSPVIYTWGAPEELTARDGAVAVAAPVVDYVVQHPGIKPGSASLAWVSGGLNKTAAVSAAGAISGQANGAVNHGSGALRVQFAAGAIPDSNSQLVVTYTEQTQSTDAVALTISGGSASCTLPQPPVPGSVVIIGTGTATPAGGSASPIALAVRDDGAGNLVGDCGAGSTIAYATGVITIVSPFASSTNYTRPTWSYSTSGKPVIPPGGGQIVWDVGAGGLTTAPITTQLPTGTESYAVATTVAWTAGNVSAAYAIAGALETPHVESVAMPALQVDLLPTVTDAIVPGSLRFVWGTHEYIDRSGTLYHSVSAATGSGTVGGTIDYTTGIARITSHQGGGSTLTLASCLTRANAQGASTFTFRLPGAPVRAGSLYVQATSAEDGSLISATASSGGDLSAARLLGYVDADGGWATLAFGSRVTAAGNETDPWYAPENVDAEGKFWRPHRVLASTVRYNCVVYSYIPLDADILGLDPVRLPQDGRVPIYRLGGQIVVHDTDAITIATPANGQTIDTGRVRLASAVLFDAAGARVDTARYTTDLDAGTLTLTNVAGLATPLRVEHRIEDQAQITDVQIDGTLRLSPPLTHGFVAGRSMCSSALVIGDLQARATVPFDQQAWTGEWSDARIGNDLLASFNNADYPISVTNEAAVTERWALIFANTTTVRVVGEHLGQIAELPIAATIAPVNARVGQPYFSINPLAWGAGWAAGNVVRFNTAAAGFPIDLARTTSQGPATGTSDSVRLQFRGDI